MGRGCNSRVRKGSGRAWRSEIPVNVLNGSQTGWVIENFRIPDRTVAAGGPVFHSTHDTGAAGGGGLRLKE